MNIFLTTTLPYVNSKPHMGHAFEFIFGDVIARHLRSQDDTEVVFNIGLDEHGVKVWEKANELGITPEQHCDRMTDVWLEFCEKFNIEYDIFYKTSSIEHHKRVKTIWNLMVYGDDIYKKHYKGQYCKGCEAYKTPKDLVNGQCPDHNIPGYVIDIEEENYFFRITKYRQAILNYVTEAPNLLVPHEKRTELINIINESEDISISRLRENCPWGVAVPGDDTQTIYVWFDALLNYIFAAGYLTPNFKWQHVIQICGPDNLRFQGLIFQAFLSALKIPFTNRLLVHGTILDDQGKKMSKSLGNTVDPMEQLEKYGVDAIRYYSVACINNYQDSSWKESELVNKFNADMCDDFGNLVARVTHLCEKNLPAHWQGLYMVDDNPEFKDELNKRFERVEAAWRKYDLNEAFRELNSIAKFGNAFISDKKPWLYKTEEEIWPILTCLTHLLYWLADYYSVIAPERCEEIKTALTQYKKIVPFTKITLK